MSPGMYKGYLKIIFFLYVWSLRKEGLTEEEINEQLTQDFKILLLSTLALAMQFIVTGLFFSAVIGLMFFEEKYALNETWWWGYFLKGSLGLSFIYGTVTFAKRFDKANKIAVEKRKQKQKNKEAA